GSEGVGGDLDGAVGELEAACGALDVPRDGEPGAWRGGADADVGAVVEDLAAGQGEAVPAWNEAGGLGADLEGREGEGAGADGLVGELLEDAASGVDPDPQRGVLGAGEHGGSEGDDRGGAELDGEDAVADGDRHGGRGLGSVDARAVVGPEADAAGEDGELELGGAGEDGAVAFEFALVGNGLGQAGGGQGALE